MAMQTREEIRTRIMEERPKYASEARFDYQQLLLELILDVLVDIRDNHERQSQPKPDVLNSEVK